MCVPVERWELYPRFWKPNELINWPIAWIIRELSFFGRKQELSNSGIPFLSRDRWSGWTVSRDGGNLEQVRNVSCDVGLDVNRSFNFIKVEGLLVSYEGSAWNDLRQARLGDEMGVYLLEGEDDLIRYGDPSGLSKEKPLLILLENAQWFDTASLEKWNSRGEKKSGECN